jgi:hypothetical protein
VLQNIPIVSSIPAPGTSPASLSALPTSLAQAGVLDITGKVTAGSGSLVLLRWFGDVAEWRVWREYHAMTFDSTKFAGYFSGQYQINSGNQYWLLYTTDSITGTAQGQGGAQ